LGLSFSGLATKDDRPYSQVRHLLGNFIGKRIVDITQQDEEEFKQTGKAYIAFHFENGGTIEIEDKSLSIEDPEHPGPFDLDEEDGDDGGEPVNQPPKRYL
jgi:hypothetical protein